MNDSGHKTISINDLLKKNGQKITPARLSILNIFIKNKIPLCALDIYKELLKDKKINNINEVTVYRNLSSLEKSGIIKIVNLRRDAVYFEMNNDHHHHIVCTNCGLIEDFKENKNIEKLLEQIAEKSTKFKNIKEHSLELFGTCKVCS
ncbi:MAG TPA: Fur family transcriptional regulator [Candidatus Paceibacterota bacterium]